MIIATRLRLRIGSFEYETTPLTLGIEDEAYVQRMLATFELSTIHRPDGSTFQAVIFPAGSFRCNRKEIDPGTGNEIYRGVEEFTAGWYAIDPELLQPKIIQAITKAHDKLERNKRGLFVPVRSAVADSFKRLFG